MQYSVLMYVAYHTATALANAEEKDLEDERMTMYTKSVECVRMSRMALLILITWMMSGNR